MIGRAAAKGGMVPLSVAIGDIMADFQLHSGQAGKAAAVEQFGFEGAPKRFAVGVIVAIAPLAPALQGSVVGQQGPRSWWENTGCCGRNEPQAWSWAGAQKARHSTPLTKPLRAWARAHPNSNLARATVDPSG